MPSELERTAEHLYSRLTPREAEIVQDIVGHLQHYVPDITSNPFLITGVGSILRNTNPVTAQDIDIAIVGLKYFQDKPNGGRSEIPVAQITGANRFFTTIVNNYFDVLANRFEGAGYCRAAPQEDTSLDHDLLVELVQDKNKITLQSRIENFTYYGSKGVVLHVTGSRPIHVHFVFNKAVEEWRDWQTTLEDPPEKRKPGKSPKFFYAVLHERKI